MRKLIAAFSLVILTVVAGCSQSEDASNEDGSASQDVSAIEAIDNAAGELDGAFEAQDASAAKALMTAGHLAVTHYYGSPQTVDEQIASLPDLKYEQTNLTEPTVTMLDEGVALRTFTAKMDGTYKGESISATVFITSVMVKQDGKWLERFYQVTALKQ